MHVHALHNASGSISQLVTYRFHARRRRRRITADGASDSVFTPLLTPDPGIYVDRITALFNAAQTSIDLPFQYITSFAESDDAPVCRDDPGVSRGRGAPRCNSYDLQ
jgi:hypothetical protein